MKFKTILATTALCAAIFAAPSAEAFQGFVSNTLNLRAGPDSSYPAVALVRAGTPVDILGCEDELDWCEVGVYTNTGWLPTEYLQTWESNQRVYLEQVPSLEVPIITFELGTFWNEHYRNKPFYRDRANWEQRFHNNPHPVYHPRPAPHPAPRAQPQHIAPHLDNHHDDHSDNNDHHDNGHDDHNRNDDHRDDHGRDHH